MNESRHAKKATPLNWHRADIVAALRKAGWSFRRLSKHYGYASPTTLTRALDGAWPKGERIVADAIGVPPAVIWPERYAQRAAAEAARAEYSARRRQVGRVGSRSVA